MADPTRVLVAGDWHGATDWAVGVIERLPELLPDESPRIVLHAGDFGIWPGSAGLGHRWSWHGRTWLALGGATSVDRTVRTPGRSWWPGEALQDEDLEAAINPGRVDVVLAHDAPASVPLNLPRPAPAWWEIERADAHRGVVQLVADAVRPSWWIHGHYHLAHETSVRMGHGRVEVTGLASDAERRGNYRVLNVRDMTWET